MEIIAESSSHTAAALQGWRYPVSLEYLALAQQVDDFRSANTDSKHKVKPWPRPWAGAKRRVEPPTARAKDILHRMARGEL